jgi:hypothetical protein
MIFINLLNNIRSQVKKNRILFKTQRECPFPKQGPAKTALDGNKNFRL